MRLIDLLQLSGSFHPTTFVAPFTFALTGAYPNQRLLIQDANLETVADYSTLHSTNGGSPALLTPTITIENDGEHVIDTPDGPQTTYGCDLVYTFTNSTGSSRQLGSINVGGFRLGTVLQMLEMHLLHQLSSLQANFLFQQDCPASWFMPAALILGETLEVGIQLLMPRHPIYLAPEWPVRVVQHQQPDTTPYLGTTRTQFKLTDNPETSHATIEDGETRVYRLAIRLQPKTTATVGSIPDGAGIWIWLLDPIRVDSEAKYGKPDLRSMGGWHGDPIQNYPLAPDADPATITPSYRGWLTNTNAHNPTIDGFGTVFDAARAKMTTSGCFALQVDAPSGWHDTVKALNYAFRMCSGIPELGPPASTTIGPAIAALKAADPRHRFYWWWGNCTLAEKSTVWDGDPVGNEASMSPSDTALIAKANLESDLALTVWKGDGIGMDVFGYNQPWMGVARLQQLKARHPGKRFYGEQGMPHWLVRLMGTYIIENTVGSIDRPMHLINFMCPGAEIIIQVSGLLAGVSAKQKVQQLADDGLRAIGVWLTDLRPSPGVDPPVAAHRWEDFGFSAITGFDQPIQVSSGGGRFGRFSGRPRRIVR